VTNDPMLSLALTLHSNKGGYVLLLGSGVSRAAQIPTGWEIVEDLVRKVARLRGEECGSDRGAWYTKTFGAAANYSELLGTIAKEPAERRQLLRSYFEPTEEEREQGFKVPTRAHKAIARLVAKGYLRVIVSSNFDRLTETAIETEGVTSAVLSTPDAIEGAVPLMLTPCTVVKIHGDYMDTRIRNTPEELDKYDPRTDRLLGRIFDEFGLIVCGWSAEWDTALRAAIESCPSRRFTTFWTSYGTLKPEAETLIGLRRAQVIPIKSADDFFCELLEKLESLEQLANPNPLSAKVAVATLKRYLMDERRRIDLHDLVTRETEEVFPQLSLHHFPVQSAFSPEELGKRLKRYETSTEMLQAMLTTGCYWGSKQHAVLWVKVFNRIANPYQPTSGMVVWNGLRLYPALVLLYAGGLAATAANANDALFAILTQPRVRDGSDENPLLENVNSMSASFDWNAFRRLPGLENHKTPVSDHLFLLLREPLREFLPDDIAYQRCFDRFEYMLGLTHVSITDRDWAPVGCYIWRGRFIRQEIPAALDIAAEVKQDGADWAPLKAGFFDGSLDRYKRVQAAFDAFIKQVSPGMMY
jgi:hypothetical protein